MKIIIAVVSLIFFCTGQLQADNSNVQQGALASYTSAGILQSYDSDKEVIVVNATEFKLAPNVIVHSMHSSFGSKSDLELNNGLGLAFESKSTIPRTVSEIWILPAGSVVGR